jgi:hypothetical protein
MQRSAHLALAVLLSVVGAFAAAPVGTHACTLDGQPTAIADGHRAVLSQDPPTAVTARTWAPFSFLGTYHARTVIRLAEDGTQLRTTLPREALERAWLWQFGDGTHTVGWTVAHRYVRPGRYRISVAAYYPTWHAYFGVDSVRIVIAR